MDEALHLLHAPLGAPGSGRVRYGAAMELFHRGLIDEAQLDVYRDASPFDGRDPALLLAERGLPPAPPCPVTPDAALHALFDASCDVLNGLPHAGAADVRAGLGRCRPRERLPAARPHPVVDRWLAPALAGVAAWQPQLARCIAAAAPHLAWVSDDLHFRAEVGDGFADGHAVARLAGEHAVYAADDFALGLLLIAPGVLHRDHCHRAPELSVPLTGPHGWRFAPGRPLILKRAGEPVWTAALQPHMTKVGRVPALCLFLWTRNVNEPARVIAADDWPLLEALSIGADGESVLSDS